MSLREAPYKLPNKKKELPSARKDNPPWNRCIALGIVVSLILGIYCLLALGVRRLLYTWYPTYKFAELRRIPLTIPTTSHLPPLLLSFLTLMANSAEGSIISVGVGHVLGAEESVRRAFVENYRRNLFPTLGTSTGQTMWKTYRNITRVLSGSRTFL